MDPDRPLTDRGIEDIDLLAVFLANSGIRVQRVIHSGKLRAQQTALRLAKVLAPGVAPEASGLLHPNDNPKAFDGHGNYSVGASEQLIFPEIDFDRVTTTRGLNITIVTTAETDEAGKALLDAFGFPFRRVEVAV